MKIGIYHGYELRGSGSNEFTYYLSKFMSEAGHDVHVICHEDKPEAIDCLKEAYLWDEQGNKTQIFHRDQVFYSCVSHTLPHANVRPVYITDKNREGNVKAFIDLSDEELKEYHDLHEKLLLSILSELKLDALIANHVVYQPIVALKPCQKTKTPMIIFPHGSSMEYTVKRDERYRKLAQEAIEECHGFTIGNHEVRDRVVSLFPDLKEEILKKTTITPVGVDTQLFSPVPMNQRQVSIDSLIAKNPGGGKDPTQTLILHKKLKKEGVGITQKFIGQYEQDLPDKDLCDHVKRINWNDKILLYVGALTVVKGVQTLIAALPFVLEEHNNAQLVIVGSGAYREVLEAMVFAISQNERELFFELCEKGKDLDRNQYKGPWLDVKEFLKDEKLVNAFFENGKDLMSHVHFLGRLDHSLLNHVYPCADITLFPSVIPEAYPLVFLESLSNGVLPMVSYIGGFQDAVRDMVTCLDESWAEKISIPTDPKTRIHTLVKHINELLSSDELYKIRPKLRDHVVQNFDWRVRVDVLVKALKNDG